MSIKQICGVEDLKERYEDQISHDLKQGGAGLKDQWPSLCFLFKKKMFYPSIHLEKESQFFCNGLIFQNSCEQLSD